MTQVLRFALLVAAAAIAGCSGAPAPELPPGDLAADSPAVAQETIAPGAEGAYEDDPLAGPGLDPSADPM